MIRLAEHTLIDWSQYFRDICSRWLLDHPIRYLDRFVNMYCFGIYIYDFRLGGVGHTVQIDERLIARRKYNRGRLIPDQWIFGMYDVNAGVGVVRYVLNRSRATILPIIEEFILPGLIQ